MQLGEEGAYPSGKAYCPKCADVLLVVPTTYGWRMICEADAIRWTRLRWEADWVEEKHTPLADNRTRSHDE